MKWISFAAMIFIFACKPNETELKPSKQTTSTILNQVLQDLELSAHQKGHIQWKLTAKQIQSESLKNSLLKDLNWTSQSNQLKLSMDHAQQPEERLFTTEQGHLTNLEFHLTGSQLQLDLKQNQLSGQSAQLKHFQGKFEFKEFQIDLETQQLKAKQVHAVINRSSP